MHFPLYATKLMPTNSANPAYEAPHANLPPDYCIVSTVCPCKIKSKPNDTFRRVSLLGKRPCGTPFHTTFEQAHKSLQ